MVDEMRDCSCKELMAICIRYHHDKAVNERCITVVEAKKLDAESLTNLIQTTLSSMGLDSSKAVAQCYDGAAAMSGVKSGVQVRMRGKKQQGRLCSLLGTQAEFSACSCMLPCSTYS